MAIGRCDKGRFELSERLGKVGGITRTETSKRRRCRRLLQKAREGQKSRRKVINVRPKVSREAKREEEGQRESQSDSQKEGRSELQPERRSDERVG